SPVPVAPAAPVAATVPPPVSPAPVAALPDATRRWEAVVTVDPSLYADPDPANPLPVDAPERVFPLDFPENLIGRRSERRAIYPEIDLSGDSGVSSRHALLYREADGSLTVLDVGSTNGTQVGGVEIAPGVRVPLTPGDSITVGCWTRLTLRLSGGNP
ncbi:MAG: FHA domain-containing protein, partial [Armatimonadetes bacterium]|nr:FHA domain-containing protein [Armatimonadota bacterium]